MKNALYSVATNEKSPKWEEAIKRKSSLFSGNDDIRTPFERDYTRIIHCMGYRRMKHKTQVFFSPENDHICTRMEHVTHVESISYTIATYLGLNVELTRSIATAHDIGHSPFGHQGERILSKISLRDFEETFWHEKNGLDVVDKIELLENGKGEKQNLNLTYAVRDGIISHCGEINEKCLKPRETPMDLSEYQRPSQYAPYTWEGCVVKVADKIAYLGRDIEDAITLGILDSHLGELRELLHCSSEETINNSVILNDLIYDLCENSNENDGLCFSNELYDRMKKINEFNYKNIYNSEKLARATNYFNLVINGIYEFLRDTYSKKEKMSKICPYLVEDFEHFLGLYWNGERERYLKNSVIFDFASERDFCKAIIFYISGMTDNYAMQMYNRIIRF